MFKNAKHLVEWSSKIAAQLIDIPEKRVEPPLVLLNVLHPGISTLFERVSTLTKLYKSFA